MPRKARLFIPGCLHHIMARGIDGMSIFKDDDDRAVFLSLLDAFIARTEIRCYAWALIPNHYHLVLRTGNQPLSSLMKPLNSEYARYFNARHKRRGYLFQDRFKSIATQDQGYIEELVRYVHLNPLRAGLCGTIDELDRYPWSGHSALMGFTIRKFQDTKTILKRFGKTDSDSCRGYQEFIALGVADVNNETLAMIRENLHGGRSRIQPGRWVIGDHEFVCAALEKDKENRLRLSSMARSGDTIADIAKRCSLKADVAVESILQRTRGGPAADVRKVFVYMAKQQGIPVAEIARYLSVDHSAVSRMVSKGQQILRKKPGWLDN